MAIYRGNVRRNFLKTQQKLRRQYEEAGMTEEQINALYEYDLCQMNRDISFAMHTIPLQSVVENSESSDTSCNRKLAEAFEPAAKKDAPKVLLLPPASRCATHAVSYLSGRGIDSEVIDFCISTGRLFESSGRYHNVVFVGHDRYGKARYANLRGIGSDFKGECNGSDKRFSFNIPAENSGILHLFESAIDLLSFATIRKLNGMDWRKDHLLSLAGVYQPREKIEESAVPLALTQYLRDHPEIKTMILRLDNDRAGRLAAKALMAVLPKDYGKEKSYSGVRQSQEERNRVLQDENSGRRRKAS